MNRDSYRHIRSAVFEKRPLPTDILDGEIAVNYHTDSVGVFIRDTLGYVRKVGPAYVSGTEPSPENYTVLSDGELWIDNSVNPPAIRFWDVSSDSWVGAGISEFPSDFDISGTLNVTNKATFDTLIKVGSGTTSAPGDIAWNADEGTLDVHLLNNVVNQVGQELQLLCRNGTATTIPDGTAVMFTDTIGNSGRIVVAPMVADGSVPGYFYFGITTQSIEPGADGYVTGFGKVRGVNTNIDEGGGVVWDDGDILWCDPVTPGGLTKVEPQAPNLKLPVAVVINAANNGVLLSRWDTGRRISDLHDVETNGTTADGELLVYNSSASRWEHKTTLPALTVTESLVVNGIEIIDSARDVEEARLIRRNGTATIGLPGVVPFGVGPVITPGMSLVGIGPDAYNVIDVHSGSVC